MHSPQESADFWSHENEDLAYVAFDVDWEDDVSVLDRLERRVDESFIKVKYERLFTNIASSLRSQDAFNFGFEAQILRFSELLLAMVSLLVLLRILLRHLP